MLHSAASDLGLHSLPLPQSRFQVALFTLHSDVTATRVAAINNPYLNFVQMTHLISLVNDDHVDNYFMEILAFVYYDSTVNNQPKNQGFIKTSSGINL